jgi:hypothetical protein
MACTILATSPLAGRKSKPAVFAVDHLAAVVEAERACLGAIGEDVQKLGQPGVAVFLDQPSWAWSLTGVETPG